MWMVRVQQSERWAMQVLTELAQKLADDIRIGIGPAILPYELHLEKLVELVNKLESIVHLTSPKGITIETSPRENEDRESRC